MTIMRTDLVTLLSKRHEAGKKHAVFGVPALGAYDMTNVEVACDIAYEYDWHVLAVWPQGQLTMILFKSRPR